MVKRIGPTFADELRASALGSADGIAWDAETGELTFTDRTDVQKGLALAVLAAHVPPPDEAPE